MTLSLLLIVNALNLVNYVFASDHLMCERDNRTIMETNGDATIIGKSHFAANLNDI